MTKLPYPNIKPNASAVIKAAGDITINGSETEHVWEGDIIFNEHHRWVQSEEGKRVEGEGKAYIFHDIFSSLHKLTGTIEIRGSKYTFSGSRLYNPDGSVHHVELRLK